MVIDGGGLREGFDEVAGNELAGRKIHAIHGGGPEENDPLQNRRSGGGMEMPRGLAVSAAAGSQNRAPFPFLSNLTSTTSPSSLSKLGDGQLTIPGPVPVPYSVSQKDSPCLASFPCVCRIVLPR